MDALFRFPAAVELSPEVERWFLTRPPGLGDRAERWFERMRACGPDVRELLHDGWPTACVEDAAFAYTSVHFGHVNLGFSEKDLRRFVTKAGLEILSCGTVTRERRPPHFEVIALIARKPLG